jgi:hypothetical protein
MNATERPAATKLPFKN